MKVLFVLPDFNYIPEVVSDYTGFNHLGLGYLSASLKKAGHKASLLHIYKKLSNQEIIDFIKKEKPDLIGYTAYSNQIDYIKKIAKLVKKNFKTPTICGGVHATVDPEDVINSEGFDMICIGEGEKTLVELCNNIQKKKDITKIKGIWVKKGRKLYKNEVANLIQNIDEIPFSDRELFDFENLSGSSLGKLNVLATRGCPYKCGYCANHQYQEIYRGKGKYTRFRSVDKVIQEIKEVRERYPFMNHVELLDDSFCLDKKWVKEFTEKYAKEINLPLVANTRIDLIDEELIKNLKKANCRELALGVESGNEKLREKVLNRFTSTKQIIKAFDLCKKYKIKTRAYVMIGIPHETIKNITETMRLSARIKPINLHLSVFQPYPNTALYNLCLKEGFIDRDTVVFGTYFDCNPIGQKSISKEEVTFAYNYFEIFLRYYELFLRNDLMLNFLDSIFTNKNLHGLLMNTKPISFFITFPIKATYRFFLVRFPNTTRSLKRTLVGA